MKLQITKDAYLKLKYYIGLVDFEISGMGKSHIDEFGNIVMTDLMIFKQEGSAAATILDDQSQAQFLFELIKNNEQPEQWNIWWHSHADMQVFWSTTDDKTITDHSNKQSYLISLVGNRKKEYKARLDIFPKDTSPFNCQGITYKEDIEVEILQDEINVEEVEKLEVEVKTINDKIKILKGFSDPEVMKECQEQIKLKVSEEKIPTRYTKNQVGFQTQFSLNKKWGWVGPNQEALVDNVVKYSLYDDEYYGTKDNPYALTCSMCGWSKAKCAEMNNCDLSFAHQEEMDLL